MNDEDLRNCFAMFSLLGLLSTTKITPYDFKYDEIAEGAWGLADAMLKARNKEKEKDDEESDVGIARVAKRTYKRKG
jgi:hypothetical protein